MTSPDPLKAIADAEAQLRDLIIRYHRNGHLPEDAARMFDGHAVNLAQVAKAALEPAPGTPVMRTGRTLGRTLYLITPGEDRKADRCAGMMDTRELAEMVVSAVNGRAGKDPDGMPAGWAALHEELAEGDRLAAVTRFEVIDYTIQAKNRNMNGRAFVAYDITAELSYQDDGRTLKVFLSDRAAGEPS